MIIKILIFVFTLWGAGANAAVTEIKLLVNGKPISNFDLEQQTKMLLVTSNITLTKENRARARERAKSQLVDNILRVEIARKNNVSATQEEINRAIKQGLQGDNSVQDFVKFLERNGIRAENFYRHMQAEVLWNKYIQRHIVPRINVPQGQVEREIEQRKQTMQQRTFLLSQIVLRFENPSEEGKIKTLAGQLKQQLSKGASFSSLARNYSHGRQAQKGGDLDWIAANNLLPKLRRVVADMKIGSISPVIRLADGYYLVLLRNARAPTRKNLNRTMLDLKIVRMPAKISQKAAMTKFQANFPACAQANDYVENLGGEVEAMGLVPLSDLSTSLQRKLRNAKDDTMVPSVRVGSKQEFILVCGRSTRSNPKLSQKSIESTILSQQAFIRARQKLRDLRRNASIETK